MTPAEKIESLIEKWQTKSHQFDMLLRPEKHLLFRPEKHLLCERFVADLQALLQELTPTDEI